jgi:hypothetical protein
MGELLCQFLHYDIYRMKILPLFVFEDAAPTDKFIVYKSNTGAYTNSGGKPGWTSNIELVYTFGNYDEAEAELTKLVTSGEAERVQLEVMTIEDFKDYI